MWQYHKRPTLPYYDLKVNGCHSVAGLTEFFVHLAEALFSICELLEESSFLNAYWHCFNHRVSDLISHKKGEKDGASVLCQT